MLKWMWSRRPVRPAPRVSFRLEVEHLEERALLSASGPGLTTVYIETNNPDAGQNAVLAFHQDGQGNLKQFGSFATGGTGQLNIPKLVGPDDGDHQVVATPDGRYLFAVNEGSHSIASFRIDNDGKLDRIGTFDSGGVQPDSLDVVGDHLYVANRGNAAAGITGTIAPNTTGFFIDGGALRPIPGSTFTYTLNTFATQVQASPDGRFLFSNVATLASNPVPTEGNTVAPFQIEGGGALQLAGSGFVGASANPTVQLGLAVNPHLNIVYAGLTASSEIGVYTYDNTGSTRFVGAVADSGAAPCWLTVSADGRVLYAANTASDSIAVYSLADPLHPVQIQDFALGGPRAGGTNNVGKAAAFQVTLDPSGRALYAITQSTDPSFPQGNQLHTLTVARDGTLSEPVGPVILTAGIPAVAHPQGIAVVRARGDRGGHDGAFAALVPPGPTGAAAGKLEYVNFQSLESLPSDWLDLLTEGTGTSSTPRDSAQFFALAHAGQGTDVVGSQDLFGII